MKLCREGSLASPHLRYLSSGGRVTIGVAVDIVQVIEEALVSGAAVAAKDQTSSAVRAALSGMRSLLSQVFRADPVARVAVDKLLYNSADPDAAAWREQLRARLKALSLNDLDELLSQAQSVLAASDPSGSTEGRYQVSTAELGTFVAGDVSVQAQTGGVAGWTIGNVRTGIPPDPTAPDRSTSA